MDWDHIAIMLESGMVWAKVKNKQLVIERVRAVAKKLGFDLVERLTSQQAHELALARGREFDDAADITWGR